MANSVTQQASAKNPAMKLVQTKDISARKTPKVNQQGQRLGPKGHQTRERLVNAVQLLLSKRKLRDLKQSDIFRVAQVSASSFYIYFADTESLVREAIARNQVLPHELDTLLREAWEPENLFEKARKFVCLYLEHWNDNYHLFKVRNLSSDEGDIKMIELRMSSQVPILEQIAAKILGNRSATQKPFPSPLAGAAIVLSSLERLGPTLRFGIGAAPREDMSNNDIIDAEAWVLTHLIANGSTNVTQ
ncbi:MAG: TetR/AcrR family transcriptional regulator [Spongiibacteraceae bacterium]